MPRWKPIKFKLHFNRINMQRGNPNVWTVCTSRHCTQVKEVRVWVPVETVFKKDGPQPRAYLTGSADVYVRKGVAYLLDELSPDRMTDDEYFEAIKGKIT